MKVIKVLLFSCAFFLQGQIAFAHPAWGIVVDSKKQIYFTDLETVWKIDAQGKLSVFRAGTSGTHVHDLSIDAQDIIYGWYNSYEPQTEKHLRSVWKISPQGEITEIVSLTENLPSGMSIWLDSDGNMYSAEPWNNEKRESKIIKRTLDGKTSLFAGGNYGYLDGKKEQAKFGNILDMAFAADGSIYLTDSNRVRKIDKFGAVKTLYPTKDSQQNQSQLFGLTVDKPNNVFVADYANRQVLKINSKMEISTLLSSEKDWSPLGVATFEDEIYVLEGRPLSSSKQKGNRVLKISGNNMTVVADLENVGRSSSVTNSSLQTKETVNQGLDKNLTNLQESNLVESKRFVLYAIAGAVFAVLIGILFFINKKIAFAEKTHHL